MKFIEGAKEGAKKVGLALRVLEQVPEHLTPQLPAPVVPEVLTLPQPPEPKEVAKETLVQPFRVRGIEHDVTLDGITYHCRVSNIKFDNPCTFADVAIMRYQYWRVEFRAMLTWKGQPNDGYERAAIAAFANAGLMVSRKLIEACVFPLQMQILEIERNLNSFG